ncbi:MAG: sulfotransferase [Pseudomonadota bacterium]
MILEILISLLAVAGFGFGLWATRLVSAAQKAMQDTMSGVSAMLDSDLDDDAKEVAARRAGLGLIAGAFRIFVSFAVALGAAAVPILGADLLGIAASADVFALMLRLDYIVIVSVVAIVVGEVIRRRRKSGTSDTASDNQYSSGDQSVHIFAFSSPSVLKGASWIEDRFIGKPDQTASDTPIFITSLARGGTTAFLNAMHNIPDVATHLYRDMPFLTSPTLWNRLAGGEKRAVERHERAHGDGLEIDLDTPEAFEEVIWKMYWPEKYRDGIDLWRSEDDRKPDAERFLGHHMDKLVQARQRQGRSEARRYCSKNNANIGRIPYLRAAFPEGKIVVVVRRPETHAASLFRQHHNFLKRHQEDAFVQRYMRDIGHFEFGQLHKPILFPGFAPDTYDPVSEDYWLNYWIKAFAHVLHHKDDCVFVLQDDLRTNAQDTMQRTCVEVGLDPKSAQFEGFFHSRPDETNTDVYSPGLLAEAEQIYKELQFVASSAPEHA